MTRDFATLLSAYQETQAAYHLAANGGEYDADAEYEAFSQARAALLAVTPATPAEACHLMAAALAGLGIDLVDDGPLGNALMAALGACLRTFNTQQPSARASDDLLLNAFDKRLRQLAALTYVLKTAGESKAIDNGTDESWLSMSIAQDLAHECLDDWSARFRGLAADGFRAGRVSS